tara:strand:+ start:40 stop:429 length:390 start_codon:yes stop_codon:yes gene_type:complete
MAITPGYGGSLSLTLDGGTIATYFAKNVTFSHSRTSLDSTSLSDFREKRMPGRIQRSATFDCMADSSLDAAIRTHMNPTTIALAQGVSCVFTYTDKGALAYTLTGHMTSATRTDDGSGPGMWSITVEEA